MVIILYIFRSKLWYMYRQLFWKS